MISPEQISLAILAGGAGERMGIPKSLLEIDRVPILEYLLGHLNWPSPTLLVTAPGRENPPGHQSFNHQVIDPVAGLGPLRGILTALEFSKTDIIVITTVDMPNIRREHLNWLATELTACPNVFGLMLQPKGDGEAIEPFPCAFRRAGCIQAHS